MGSNHCPRLVSCRKLLVSAALGLLPFLALSATANAAEENYPAKPTTVVTFPATTVEGTATKPLASFDISFVDNAAGIYLLADRSNASVDVLDLNFNNMNVISPSNTGCTVPQGKSPNCAFSGLATDPNAGPINDVSGPNGVATVNDREVWAGDGPTLKGPIPANADCQKGNLSACKTAYLTVDNCDSTVKVIDLRSHQVTDSIDTGGCFRADEVAFDPDDQVFIVANDAEQDIGNPNFVTLISTAPGHQVLAKIVFDGNNGTPNATAGIEQPIYDPQTHKFFVAVPANGGTFANPSDTGALAEIDPKGHTVSRTIKVNNCTPNGIAIGPDHNAFLGCNAAEPVQIVNLDNGQVVQAIDQLRGGCDEVWYDAKLNHFLGACSQHATASPLEVAGVVDAPSSKSGPAAFDQNITTKSVATDGATPHSIAADSFTGRIIVPLGTGNSLCNGAQGCIAMWQEPGDADNPDMTATLQGN